MGCKIIKCPLKTVIPFYKLYIPCVGESYGPATYVPSGSDNREDDREWRHQLQDTINFYFDIGHGEGVSKIYIDFSRYIKRRQEKISHIWFFYRSGEWLYILSWNSSFQVTWIAWLTNPMSCWFVPQFPPPCFNPQRTAKLLKILQPHPQWPTSISRVPPSKDSKVSNIVPLAENYAFKYDFVGEIVDSNNNIKDHYFHCSTEVFIIVLYVHRTLQRGQ